MLNITKIYDILSRLFHTGTTRKDAGWRCTFVASLLELAQCAVLRVLILGFATS